MHYLVVTFRLIFQKNLSDLKFSDLKLSDLKFSDLGLSDMYFDSDRSRAKLVSTRYVNDIR